MYVLGVYKAMLCVYRIVYIYRYTLCIHTYFYTPTCIHTYIHHTAHRMQFVVSQLVLTSGVGGPPLEWV